MYFADQAQYTHCGFKDTPSVCNTQIRQAFQQGITPFKRNSAMAASTPETAL